MGVINHNCVLATTWDVGSIGKIKNWIEKQTENIRSLFVFVPALTNGYTTVIMAPDGGKEGWRDSDRYNCLRDEFIEFLSKDCYSDGSSPWGWVEVGYGEYGQKVLRGNCKNRYSDIDYYAEQ